MRDTFVAALSDLARSDKNIMLLTADLGFGVLTKFAEQFPRQFLNVGVAEQNMTGLATGLALEGKSVFTYSIGNFPTMRCLEQIRNDVCYHKANVKIISIGGGFCYGPLGISHHATEDLAVMRAIPNLTVVAPGDLTETMLATKAIYECPGPCYMRLGRGGEPRVHKGQPQFILGKTITLLAEGDVALISTGAILSNVIQACELLDDMHISASIHSCHSLQPMDAGFLERLSKSSKLIVTIEEHSIIGGLGGAVAEILAEIHNPKACLLRIGVREGFTCEVGDQDSLREFYGLSPRAIAERVRQCFQNISRG